MAQIPNNSFESWTNMGTYNNPDQWGTMNNLSALGSIFTAEKGTPGNPGSSYLKLTSKTTPFGVLNGIAVSGKLDSLTMKPISGFAYNLRPQNFTGKWQHMIYGTSQGAMTATLTKWNTVSSSRDTVAIANLIMTGMVMSWGTFTIPFVYNNGDFPDTCIIFLRASGPTPSNLDYLYVDDLSFTGTVAGIEPAENTSDKLFVFPNPANNNLSITLNETFTGKATIELNDLKSNVVFTKTMTAAEGNSLMIDTRNIAAGTYLVNVKGQDYTISKKVVVTH
jgi:hypothetical protein